MFEKNEEVRRVGFMVLLIESISCRSSSFKSKSLMIKSYMGISFLQNIRKHNCNKGDFFYNKIPHFEIKGQKRRHHSKIKE